MERKEYVWVLIIACGLAAGAIGLCSNSVGVFYTVVSQELGVLRGTFAFHATLSLMATAVVSLWVPWLSKHFSYKPILITGIFLSAAATVFMGMSGSIAMFYILGVLRGIGVGLYGTVPITMLVNRWFHKRNGAAIGMALSFSGLSGALCSPLLSNLIAAAGWRNAYIVMGGLILVFTLPACILPFSMGPEERGRKPYGYEELPKSQKGKIADSSTSRFSYMQAGFVLMCIFTVLHTSITGITQHFSGYSQSLGLGETFGAALMSCSMMGNICTKLFIGFISDRLGSVKACLMMMGVNAGSLMVLMNGTGAGTAQLLIAAFLFGSVYSVGAVGIPLLTRYFFGNEHYPQAYSVIGFFTSIGSSSSLAIIGYLFDLFGTYRYAFAAAACFHLINSLLLLGVVLWRKITHARTERKKGEQRIGATR